MVPGWQPGHLTSPASSLGPPPRQGQGSLFKGRNGSSFYTETTHPTTRRQVLKCRPRPDTNTHAGLSPSSAPSLSLGDAGRHSEQGAV